MLRMNASSCPRKSRTSQLVSPVASVAAL